MKKLTINDKYICDIPSNWNELSEHQLLKLCSVLPSASSANSLLIQLLLLFSKTIPYHKSEPRTLHSVPHFHLYNSKSDFFWISAEDLAFAASPLHFICEPSEDKPVINSRLFVNVMPSFSYRGTTLFGPDSALFNITFAEFIKLETVYEKYAANPSVEKLDQLVAVLYRRANHKFNAIIDDPSGDLRLPFNDHHVSSNIPFCSSLPSHYKLAILLFYEGCRWYIFSGCKLFPNAFSSSDSPDTGFPSLHEYTKLINSLCGNDSSKMERKRNTLAWDVFYELEAHAVYSKSLKSKNHV